MHWRIPLLWSAMEGLQWPRTPKSAGLSAGTSLLGPALSTSLTLGGGFALVEKRCAAWHRWCLSLESCWCCNGLRCACLEKRCSLPCYDDRRCHSHLLILGRKSYHDSFLQEPFGSSFHCWRPSSVEIVSLAGFQMELVLIIFFSCPHCFGS